MRARNEGRWVVVAVVGALGLGAGCTRPEEKPAGLAVAGASASAASSAAPISSLAGKYSARQVGYGQVVGQEQVDALNKGAIQALEQHDFDGAIAKAKSSIAIDQTSAWPYLHWGAALIEKDRRTEARQVFIECMRTARKGPVEECERYLH